MQRADGYVALGKIVGVHGVRGELQVYPYTEEPEALSRYGSVYVPGPGGELRAFEVQGVRTKGWKALLLLDGVFERKEAEAFLGLEIFQAKECLPPTDEGEYYWHELVGLNVITTGGLDLGTLQRIIPTGGHDVYVVAGEGGEIFLPAIEEVIREVDLLRGLMVVKPVPGLFEANAL
jgi:16S rRNA processing protein RimM